MKGVYLPDVAIQYHVLKKARLEAGRVCLAHINRTYLYDGHKLDPDALFVSEDLTGEAIAYQDKTVPQLEVLKDMLKAEAPPGIRPSRHCRSPYQCEFWEHCTQDAPENWVYWTCRESLGRNSTISKHVESGELVPSPIASL